ncbi:hypothetical protein THAOC_36038, partial [Thalassiosira oceanica]
HTASFIFIDRNRVNRVHVQVFNRDR